MSADKLALAVAAGDSKAITKANGVGKKTAERIVLELKDKMAGVAVSDSDSYISAAASVEEESSAGEAVAALVALGYGKSEAAAVLVQWINHFLPMK